MDKKPEQVKAKPTRARQLFKWLVRLTCVLILLLLAFLVIGWLFITSAPKKVVDWTVPYSGIELKLSDASWGSDGKLTLKNVLIGDYFKAESIDVKWDWIKLCMKHEVELVDIHSAQVWVGRLAKANAKGKTSSKTGSPTSWKVERLGIFASTIYLDNLDPSIPPVPITLGLKKALVFKSLYIGAEASGPDFNKEQTATIDNLIINSPYDALSPVLEFKAINLHFTWAELLKNKIRAVSFINPILYVGPDLFWFADQFKKTKAGGSNTGWSIQRIRIRAGRLCINAFGQPGVTLPFYFVCDAENANLDKLSELPLKAQIVIPPQDKFYPEYKVRIDNLRGKIEFSLPLTEHKENNVVPTIFFDSISWNDLAITKAWSSVTFDPTGIYGQCGGDTDKGYVNGNFSILFSDNYPWHGELYATGVDAGKVTDQLAAKRFHLDGQLKGQLSVDGKSREIVKSVGEMELAEGGKMEIYSLDPIIANLPATWNSFKRSAAEIILDAFRTYSFDSGKVTLNYQPPESKGQLILMGPQGSRNFDIQWHQRPDGEAGEPDIQIHN